MIPSHPTAPMTGARPSAPAISSQSSTFRDSLLLVVVVSLPLLWLWLWLSSSTGQTWDEPIYSVASENAVRWLELVVRGHFADAADPYNFGVGWGLNNETTPLVRILNGIGWVLAREWLPVPVQHRIGTITLAAVAVGVMTALAARWRGRREALFAALSIATLPRLVFHAQLGATDFALAATWGMATLIFYQQMRVDQNGAATRSFLRTLHRAFVIGAWAAIAVLAKINAVLLAPFWGLWVLIFRRHWVNLARLALAAPIALLVIYTGWPWIWKDPIAALSAFLREYSNHPAINQWFAGQLYVETPWYVPVAIFLITTPVLLLVLALIGATGLIDHKPEGAKATGSRVIGNEGATTEWIGLHLLGMAVIVLYFGLPLNNIHDQDRMLSPAYIHLAFLSGVGFDRFWHWLQHHFPRLFASNGAAIGDGMLQARTIVLQVVLAGLLVMPGAVAIARLHPYELAYYNELVGGPTGARQLDMETIYFASTYSYFLPMLNQLPPGSKLWVIPNSWSVFYYYQQHGLLQPDLVLMRPPGWGSFYDDQGVPYEVGLLSDADYALIERRQTSFNSVTPEGALQLEWVATKPELARLERAGVVLAGLYAKEVP